MGRRLGLLLHVTCRMSMGRQMGGTPPDLVYAVLAVEMVKDVRWAAALLVVLV